MKYRLDLPRNPTVADTDQRSLYEVWDTIERYEDRTATPPLDRLLSDQPAEPTTSDTVADEPIG